MLIVFLLVYTAVVVPFRVSFIDSTDIDGWFVNELIMDFLFLLDICFTFNTPFFDKQANMVYNRREIAREYLTGWFLIDLVTTIPFQLLEINHNEEHDSQGKA